jgi:hypothetical protein
MGIDKSPIFSVSGVDGTLKLYEDRLELRRKGVATKVFRGFTNLNVYQVSEIGDIKITDPPMWGTRGSATIRLAGDHTPPPSRNTAVKDQDSILLASKNDADAMENFWLIFAPCRLRVASNRMIV